MPRWTSAASGQGFAEGEERARTKQQFSVGIVAVLRGNLPSDYSTGNSGGASPFLASTLGTVGAGATAREGK